MIPFFKRAEPCQPLLREEQTPGPPRSADPVQRTANSRLGNRYGIAPPTEQEAIDSIARTFSPTRARTIWNLARYACGYADASRPLSLEELAHIADFYRGGQGAMSVIGQSLYLRIASYRQIMATEESIT